MNRDQVQIGFSLLLLAALAVAFAFVLSSLAVALVVAGVIALVLRHPHGFLVRRLGVGRGVATGIVVVVAFLVVAGAGAFFGGRLAREVETGISRLLDSWPIIVDYIRTLPFAERLIDQLGLAERIQELLGTAAGLMLEWTQAAVGGLASTAFRGIVVLYVVIYLLLDGPKVQRGMRRVIPLPEASMDAVLSETSRTLDATVLGTFVIAAIEGVYGALLFAIFGLPSPLLWGMVMTILSALPVIGINAVLVPSGVVLILLGAPAKGIVIILLAVAGTLITQNVLRPRLVGQGSGLHPVLVLVSTLGGLAWLGLVGFFVGPIVATLLLILWRQVVTAAGASAPTDEPASADEPAPADEPPEPGVSTQSPAAPQPEGS